MRDIEDFIADLPIDERRILQRLRAILFEVEPRFKEKLSYGVPYYFRTRRVCFLWPISAPLAPKVTNDAKVIMGFCYADRLSNAQQILFRGNRKQVYTISFSHFSEIDEQALKEIVLEALLVDATFKKKKS